MVLGEGLTDRDGHAHAMAGLLPVTTSFAAPGLHLGYRRLTLLEKGALGPKNLAWRGHEFHYASETERAGSALFATSDAMGQPLGPTGCVQGNVMGSFCHLIDRHPALGPVT